MRYLCIAFALTGCAEIFPPSTPGTPGGGPFCSRLPSGESACYPTEAERAAAWANLQEEQGRPAREAARAAAAEDDARSRAEFERMQEARAADAERARVEQADHAKAWVAARDAKDQEKAAVEAQVHAKALDQTYAVPAISAIMCSIDDEVRGLKKDLEREKRVTAVGGVTNLRARNEIASDLVDDADELKGWQASLTRYGGQRMSCKEVAAIEPCRHALESCEGATRNAAEVWARELDTLWGSSASHPAR